MDNQSRLPINVESAFRIEELFFSTTDEKGIIQSGNTIFSRVSKYELTEMLGEPHSLVRHPDTPRTVFKILWDYLLSGRSIAAYVKNMASDGSYYWVVALATPIQGGYLSVRFKPSGAIFAQVKELYQQLRAIERENGERGEARKEGMALAEKKLREALQQLECPDYDSFMRVFLREELKSRDAILADSRVRPYPHLPTRLTKHMKQDPSFQLIRDLWQSTAGMHTAFLELFSKLDDLVNISAELTDKADYVLKLTRSFRFIALNTAIRSAHLGTRGGSLCVIAEHMGHSSRKINSAVRMLTGSIGDSTGSLQSVIFQLAAARLQIEVVLTSCVEVAELLAAKLTSGATDVSTALRALKDLHSGLKDTIDTGFEILTDLQQGMGGLDGSSNDLWKEVLTLQFSQLSGLVESTRLGEDGSMGVIFEHIRSQLDRARTELASLRSIVEQLSSLLASAPRAVSEARASAELNNGILSHLYNLHQQGGMNSTHAEGQ